MYNLIEQLREIDIYVKAVNKPLVRAFGLLKDKAANYFARTLVPYPEHDATAAPIGQGA